MRVYPEYDVLKNLERRIIDLEENGPIGENEKYAEEWDRYYSAEGLSIVIDIIREEMAKHAPKKDDGLVP